METTPAREVAGRIIERLIDYKGESMTGLATRGHGLSPKTIQRIIRGDATVTPAKYLPLDNLLGLPIGTMLRIVDGDPEAIRALPWQPGDVYVREFILAEMGNDGQSTMTRQTG